MQNIGLKGFPLSIQQERLWSFQPESQTYLNQVALWMDGMVDLSLFMQALTQVVGRHEILHTIFPSLPSMERPLQVLVPTIVRCPVVDLQMLNEREHETEWQRDFSILLDEPFDLVQGPLLRILLFRLSPQVHLCLVSLSAWCSDATGVSCLLTELFQWYSAFCKGDTLESAETLLEEPLQYNDVASWHTTLLQNEHAKVQIPLWTATGLAQLSQTCIPFDTLTEQPGVLRPMPREQIERIPLILDAASFSALERLAQQWQVSLVALILTCWQGLLTRLTGQQQAIFGIACTGRDYEDLALLPGLYTRFVPLQGSWLAHMSLQQAVYACEQELTILTKQQRYFTWPKESQTPHIFPLVFEYEQSSPCADLSPSVDGSMLKTSIAQQFSHIEPFVIKLRFHTIAGQPQLELQSDHQRVALASLNRLAALMSNWLRQISQQPEGNLQQRVLLSSDEQKLLNNYTSGATRDPLPVTSVYQLFEQQANDHPDQLALVSGSEQCTYRFCNERSNQLAHWLRSQGMSSQQRIALCLPRSIQMIIALLGVWKAGCAYVPLDVDFPADRLSHQLHESETQLVLTSRRTQALLQGWDGPISVLDELWSMLDLQPVNNLSPGSAQDLAYIMYTSGSTGKPKGVLIQQQNIINYTQALCELIAPGIGWHFATVSTLAADLGNTAIFLALATGGCLHIFDYETITSSEKFYRQVYTWPLDVLKIVPSHLQTLLNSHPASLRLPICTLILGGERLTVRTMQRVQEQVNCQRLINHYGPTETTIGVLAHLLTPADGTAVGVNVAWGNEVPLGSPLANTQAYLLDAQLQCVPIGLPGELYLGGLGVGAGYWHQPALTAERFLPHPSGSQAGARLYRTGDLAILNEQGMYVFLGRCDTQAKIRGYRVELGEIETILKQHPSIWDAVVTLVDSDVAEPRLVAYSVPVEKMPPAADELRDFLRAQLPEHMLPALFVFLDQLPLTPNGKVDRRNLPAPVVYEPAASKVSRPLSPIEDAIMGIWKDLLHIPAIGIDESFFHLGGHSLLATQVISRLHVTLHAVLSIRDLFEAPTVAQLAQRVERAQQQEEMMHLPALRALPRPSVLPLSFAQQRLWMLEQIDPTNTSYLLPTMYSMRGQLSFRALDRSYSALVERHEILRTSFQVWDEQPVQIIHPACSLFLPLIDLRALLLPARQKSMWQLGQQEAEQPFDLAYAPPFRLYLIWCEKQEYILFSTLHHIISDGWSNQIFSRELAILYQASLLNRPSALPSLPIQYADYALWQRAWLQGEVLEQQAGYWRRQLADLTYLELPLDWPRPHIQSFNGATQMLIFSNELQDALQRICQSEHVTLFMLLLAAFQVLLARYSGQSDIVVGTPISNRSRTEVEGLIGYFINTLVLRSDLAGNPSFSELLGRVREMTLEAYAHQDMPFEYLVEMLQPERDLSRSPFFQVLVSLQHVAGSVEKSPFGSKELETFELPQVNLTAKYDLTLLIIKNAQELHCGLEYNTDLFSAETIARLLEHWQRLLEQIVIRPQARLADYALLTPQEELLLLKRASAVSPSLPALMLPALLAQQSVGHEDAVMLQEGELQLSSGYVERQTTHWAQHLRALGVGPDVLVALYVPRQIASLLCLLAVLKSGGAYLPVEETLPTERVQWLLQDAAPGILLTTQQKRESSAWQHWPAAKVVLLEELNAPLTHVAAPLCSEQIVGAQLAYVLYTSGSTGVPKGVQISHRGLLNYVLWAARSYQNELQSGCGSLLHSSLGFDLTVTSLWVPWLQGERITLVAEAQGAVSLLRVLHEQGIQRLLKLTPAHLQLLAHELREEELSTVAGVLVIGGEALTKQQVAPWRRWAPQSRLINEYGPTETVVGCSIYEIQTQDGSDGALSIGSAIANTELYIVDEYLHLVPVGIEGELVVGGAGVARGYRGQGGLTAERFVPHPWSQHAGERLYRTGDRARLRRDGLLEYLGRRDGQVKVRGYRIELAEIEAVLASHVQVQQAVVQVQHSFAEDLQLVAYVVAITQSAQLNELNLKRYLGEILPGYMVPAVIMQLEALPLTRNGKVDRHALPSVSSSAHSDSQQTIGLWSSPLLEIVAGIWQQLLGRTVQPEKNFLEQGGHSLLAIQLLIRIRTHIGIEIPLITLFESPTLITFVERVEQALRGEHAITLPRLQAVPRSRAFPLSFAQQRLWFIERLDPGNIAFHIRNYRRIHGILSFSALLRSMKALVQRHESLRTTFEMRADAPIQIIHPVAVLSIPVVDLRALKQESRVEQQEMLARAESRRPFNLTEGPLLRVHLLRLENTVHILLITMHHIISDGWSDIIFGNELNAFYQAFSTSRPLSLSPLPIQYADYAFWQRQYLQGEVLAALLHYWQENLAGIKPLQLPTDRARTEVQSYRGSVHYFQIDEGTSRLLVALSQQEQATLFMTLLAAFQILLARYAHQDDIIVGTDVAGRNYSEVEGIIGFFINQLVLRTRIDRYATFRQLLRQVQKNTLQAYAHQDLPFDKLVEALHPERSIQQPLFQVKLLLQNIDISITQRTQQTGAADAAITPLDLPVEIVQNHLILRLFQTPGEIKAAITYNIDLFDHSTIKRMAGHFLALLENICREPESKIHALELVTPAEKEKEQMLKKDRDAATLTKFKAMKPKPLQINQESLVKTEYLPGLERFPLVLRPQQQKLDLIEWTKNNLEVLEAHLLSHGALLFRGCTISDPSEFERFAAAINPDLYQENGEHVQVKGVGDGRLYTPVFYAPDKKLLWHNENSFNYNWPMRIWFYCAQPANQGGETPIVDSRKVFQLISPSIRQQFLQKGIVYVRNYGDGLGLHWQEVFRTTNKKEVEAYCQKAAIDFVWRDGDRLRTQQRRPAVLKHPRSSEWLWWNQAMHWHPSCLEPEGRQALQALFKPEDLPRNCFYGDGTQIDDATISEISAAYQQAEVSFPWQTGDILMLDNMLVAHARNPFVGPRKIYVSMGGMISLQDLQ